MRYSRAESSAAVGDYEDGDIAIASYVGKSSRNATNTTANSLSSRSRSGGSNVNNSGNNTNSNYNVNDNDDGDHPPPPADSDSGDDDDSDGTAGLAMSSQLMAKLKLGRSIDAAAVEPKRVGSGMLRVGDVANGLHCNECGMFCADDHVLFVHKQQAHKSPTGTVGNSSTGVPRKPTSPQPVLSPTATLRCGLCHKTMSTKAELDAHVEKHESDLGLKDVATTTLGALYGLSKAGDAVSASGKTEKVSLAALGGAASAPTSSTPPAKKTKKKLFGSSSGKQKSSDGKK